ncbi:[protein-PII] uridylyltransferase [Novosphingobium pokkalii]|uniref:Bifunctional uridylyltransferase/uridylyl-removing enzyme n=1 Tax=Novosphingobium pokkalii TaxID=1770194 RepID=A0ABV7V3Z0_9SPHN|nr:[protein-PII] uridylyltransferase [Novosphingobium pokkalii]GHD03922.1 bifunctional uridylyltransferase/uridylyl-removing enzyme [Novosphingobium pokkalii]
MTLPRIAHQRAIIDRRTLAEAVSQAVVEAGGDPSRARPVVVEHLRAALAHGRDELARRLRGKPSAGYECAQGQAFLVDQLVRVIHDYVIGHVYRASNRTTGERIAVLAVGGYGRGEMAPHSDVDIAFVTPNKPTAWCEQVIEAMLYFLWDLGLKVGHSSRSLDETVRMAKSDLTIRTALLEGRYVWGDRAVYEECARRFWAEVTAGTERQFVAEKLAERNERHKRLGDSRYVVEPNVKEGKGGLRDLHTLYWIGKYVHKVRDPSELVDVGLLTAAEYRAFHRAENFFWAVRCHLHMITRRAEDRLTFDLQREVAARMAFADRPGKSSVERFMQFFFLQAKQVGSLTGVFMAQLDEQFARTKPGFFAALRQRRKRKVSGFPIVAEKVSVPGDDFFAVDPVRLIEIFVVADKHGLEIHPEAMRLARRDAGLIDGAVRKDPRANALFLELLTSRHDPETVLRWMNEAGVFGRFIPDFGRVVAQMQFDMYHHYTVDEHTIRAIGLLARIEKGEEREPHPLASNVVQKVASRRVLYIATLLHDIAKGRRGDHSILGAEVARKLCPRLGLSAAETELVSWLVRWHLLMSATAFKRDLADYKTIADFAAQVQSAERLRLLLILTIVDIRAVGPGIWNSWKRQLLGDLFVQTEEMLRLGHKQHGRPERIAAKKKAVGELLKERDALIGTVGRQLGDAYWIAEPEDIIALNLQQMDGALGEPLSVEAHYYPARGATLVTVLAADHAGLFYRLAGAIHLAGGNIIDARIHTTRNGLAVDNFLVQDPLGRPLNEARHIERLKASIADALSNRVKLMPQLAARPLARPRAEAFDVQPIVIYDNKASNRFTVVEVGARDRPALLGRLAHALFDSRLVVHSAHIATYGERAVDTFYVTDILGEKVTSDTRLRNLERRLLDAAEDRGPGGANAAAPATTTPAAAA